MAQYVTNFTKSPIENLVGLVNNDNNFGYAVADLSVQNLTAGSWDIGGHVYNTQISIDPLTDELGGDFVPFHYDRVDLATLFSQITPTIRQADVALDETGIPADPAVFYAEVLRKYGVALNTADFTYAKKSAGVITVTANASNVMYIGSFDVAIGSSLAARVAVTKLSGFHMSQVAAA